VKTLFIRIRAKRVGQAYAQKHGVRTPKSHRDLLRLFRLRKGYPAFKRCLPELNDFPEVAANRLESFFLETGKPIHQCPEYGYAMQLQEIKKVRLIAERFSRGVDSK
jgi:hypothetical protein